MNSIFEDMEEEQSSNINNLEQDDLTSVASLAKKQKNQEQTVRKLTIGSGSMGTTTLSKIKLSLLLVVDKRTMPRFLCV